MSRHPWYFGPIDVEDAHLSNIHWKRGDVRLLDDTEIDGELVKGQTLFAEIEEEAGKVDVLWVNALGVKRPEQPTSPEWPFFITDPNKLARHRHDPRYPECIFNTGTLGVQDV